MATEQVHEFFLGVMARRSTTELLALLRERHDYVPDAVSAALAELKRRDVSGFDVANAMDDGDQQAREHFATAHLPMETKWVVFWLLLPFFAMSPFGTRYFHRLAAQGYRRRSIQFLEVVTIGFTGYMIVLMLFLFWQ